MSDPTPDALSEADFFDRWKVELPAEARVDRNGDATTGYPHLRMLSDGEEIVAFELWRSATDVQTLNSAGDPPHTVYDSAHYYKAYL